MEKLIIYKTPENRVSVMYPCDCGLSTIEIGVKDVPCGLPFWIIDSVNIPSDRTYRDAWDFDAQSLGDPAGVGGAQAPREQK